MAQVDRIGALVAAALQRFPDAFSAMDTDRREQHLLLDPAGLATLVEFGAPNADDAVLDIGAGPGVLTEVLSEIARHVWAFEIDERFRPLLSDVAERRPNVDVVFGDVRTATMPEATKLVANPPFALVEHLAGRILVPSGIAQAGLVVGSKLGRSLTSEPATDSRIAFRLAAHFEVVASRRLEPASFTPPMRSGAYAVALSRRRVPDWLAVLVADALAEQGGRRVRDLLWFLGRGRPQPLGSPQPPARVRHSIAATARERLRPMLGTRLQALTGPEIAALMEELGEARRQVADGGADPGSVPQ